MGVPDELLKSWDKKEEYATLDRLQSSYNPLHLFSLPPGDQKQYMQQYGDMYFLRLAKLKPVVEEIAGEEWDGFKIAGEEAQRVERVLDVRQGQLCWVAGTIYMDMPLKPNILEDISKEHWIAGPPPRQSYFSHEFETQVMLEDESGRLRLTGSVLKSNFLVTGIILAVLGTENANGDFEVLDVQLPELPPQPQRWERDDHDAMQGNAMNIDHKEQHGKKIALISGLNISGTDADTLNISLLGDFLLGESLGPQDQALTTQVSRLIIAGNSISPDVVVAPQNEPQDGSKKTASKKYGYDASAYNPTPTEHLDQFLSELLPSIPVTIMSGEQDPANASLPQQGIHPAMFPHSRAYSAPPHDHVEGQEPGWFDSVTNPWESDIEGWRFMGNSGQPVDDILKYIELGGPDGQGPEGRLQVMESMLRWRCVAPTAPDTLWCYPFQDKDQFVIEQCPHVYFVGNQPRFSTTVIAGPAGQRVRLITVPKFNKTGEIVLLDTETLTTEMIRIAIYDVDNGLT